VEIPVWRLVTIDRCRRTGRKVVSWIPRLAAFAVALKLAVVLADGPYVVGYIGSLFFIAVLLAGAVLLAIALCRLAVAAGQRAATASSAILPRVRFYLALAWLAISK
jgi:hypothetical protein